ncbi:MAG: ubiquinol-cytochrome c reductase iron-sulfur subunit [Lysobacterales bacterium]|nr:ubiquinol-cytochrome c reductase iron-sulfur subunit [Xanthomonadales bacterium]MCB1610424.1 ubiquinol-cytochrome c reductase iron-sulfur subunit [Xanthomonadales bacterium]
MAAESVNHGRRRFLTASTVVVGGVGGVFAAIPFISAWKPSARAVAAGAPVSADISKLAVGTQMTVAWRGRPIFIVRRSEEMLSGLAGEDGRLKDPKSEVVEQQPEFAKNEYRSLKPDVLVLVGSCTHLGCSPKLHPEVQPEPWDAQWKGGYYCPCHNSRFDLAGRVYEGSPAPTNLVVPPYRFESDTRVIIGESEGAA